MAQIIGTLTVGDAWDGRVAIVTVQGEIDFTTAGTLRECLDRVISEEPERLIIDLGQVAFLDCSAVHAFVWARHTLAGPGRVSLRSPGHEARRVFEVTGLNSLCAIE
jgi:anti-sigma B factor antagonist